MISSRRLFSLLICFSLLEFIQVSGGVNGHSKGRCQFPAIYNLGDSNSDTEAMYAVMAKTLPPNGMSFFGSHSGRASDGRLIIDFITEELNLPYLSAYLNSIGSNYRNGANFAAGSASIIGSIYNQLSLAVQVSQFKQFKSHSKILFDQLSNNRTEPPLKSGLPRPEDFSRALYIIDIGQNDLTYGFMQSSVEQVRQSIPGFLGNFSIAVEQLYNEGARVFWIHNTGPIGCLPRSYHSYEPKMGNLDAHGCVKPQNEIAQEFNRKLKEQVVQLRTKFSQTKFTYINVYTAKYKLISNAKSQGFGSPMKFCCGSYPNYFLYCGLKATINETIYGNPCENPSKYISWDGIYYSQAANQWIAKQIFHGSLSDPPIPIGEACF